MNASTLTPARIAPPTAEPRTTRTPDRKIFFGTAAILLVVTTIGLALAAGAGTDGAPTTGAAVPAAGAESHVTPDHILQPR